MVMELKPAKDFKKRGKLMLAYGETGVGKTTSILQSAPAPVVYIVVEPRNFYESLEASGRDKEDIQYVVYTNFEDMIDFLVNLKMEKGTIVIDSLSYLMNVMLANEIQDQVFSAIPAKDKERKSLIAQTKMSQESYGALADQMLRMVKVLAKKTLNNGNNVICISLVTSEPKFDASLAAGPNFTGKKFGENFPELFDLIGLVQERKNKEGKVIYPPAIFFESTNNDAIFLSKFSGVKKKRYGLLNIEKLLTPDEIG